MDSSRHHDLGVSASKSPSKVKFSEELNGDVSAFALSTSHLLSTTNWKTTFADKHNTLHLQYIHNHIVLIFIFFNCPFEALSCCTPPWLERTEAAPCPPARRANLRPGGRRQPRRGQRQPEQPRQGVQECRLDHTVSRPRVVETSTFQNCHLKF